MHAVQVSLQQVLDALADDRIDHKRAGLMLYGIQQAAAVLNSATEWKGSRPQVELDHPLRAIAVPELEEQYALPNDIDLEAPPDVAVAEAELKENLPAGQEITKPQHTRLERVPNFRPKMYFSGVDASYANKDDSRAEQWKKLRRSLNSSLAAHAGEDTDDDGEPRPARPKLPHQFYGELEKPQPPEASTLTEPLIRSCEVTDKSQPLTEDEFAINYLCNDEFRNRIDASSTKQGF